MYSELLKYDLGAGVEAFSTRRKSELPYPVIQGHQVHEAKVAFIERPGMTREELEGYDVFVTTLPDVAIGVRTADCVPVLLYEPVKQVVAAAHAGWKGTVLHISEKTVELMTVIHAVEGEGLFALSERGTVILTDKAETLFTPSATGNCRYQLPGSKEWTAQMLEKIRVANKHIFGRIISTLMTKSSFGNVQDDHSR